jgi:hypothetical protein
MMDAPGPKADSTDKVVEDHETARFAQKRMGWWMFGLLLILVVTGWWIVLIAALLTIASAALTVSNHPDYSQTRKRWMYALYAFCALFFFSERNRVSELMGYEQLFRTTKVDNADTSNPPSEAKSREQALQAQVDRLNQQLTEARAGKPPVVQVPQVAEQLAPVVQPQEAKAPVARPRTAPDPDNLKVLSKDHFLTTFEKSFIEDVFAFSPKSILRTIVRVKQIDDSVISMNVQGAIISKEDQSVIKTLDASKLPQKNPEKFRIRGDYLEVQNRVEGRGGFEMWEKWLKLGAKPGDQWEEEFPEHPGVKNKYRFVGFEENFPLNNAIVECEMKLPSTPWITKIRRTYKETFGMIAEERSSNMKGGDMEVMMTKRLTSK